MTVQVALALPTGVVAVGETTRSRVSITIRPVTATRTFSAGLRLVGAEQRRSPTRSSVDRVLVTIGGSTADLDRLSGAALVVDLDVTGLKAGTHDVPVTGNLPVGTTVVAVSPPTVDGDHRHDRRSPRRRAARRPSRAADPGWPACSAPTASAVSPTSTSSRPLAYALGRAAAHRLVGRGGALVVGQDTRRSGDMFVAAIAAGATSMGVDVHSSASSRRRRSRSSPGRAPFAAGIMVSASHNPADDNGLKVLDGDGLKLDDAVEDELERLIWRTEELPGAPNDELGRMIDASGRLDDYRAHRLGLAATDRRRRPAPRARRRERVGLGGRPRDPRGDRRPRRGHPRRARRHQHQRRLRRDRAGIAGRGRRRGAAPTPASRSTATPTG